MITHLRSLLSLTVHIHLPPYQRLSETFGINFASVPVILDFFATDLVDKNLIFNLNITSGDRLWYRALLVPRMGDFWYRKILNLDGTKHPTHERYQKTRYG